MQAVRHSRFLGLLQSPCRRTIGTIPEDIRPLKTIKGQDYMIRGLAWSLDGKYLAFNGSENTFHLLNYVTNWSGKEMTSLSPPPLRTVRTRHRVHGSSNRRTPRGALLL